MNRRDGLETRGRLLDAAASCFAARGFDRVSVAEICRAAGANLAAVNYHFGSKENLYAEAWRHAFERSIEAYPLAGGVPPEAPPEERLEGVILALLHRLLDPAARDFAIAHQEIASPTGLLAEVMDRGMKPLRQALSGIVRDLLGARASEAHVELCAMSVFAQCVASFLHARRHRLTAAPPARSEPAELDVLADHILQFSLAGIRGGKPRGSPARKSPATRRGKARP